jgi:hypothetical protein
MFVGAKVFSGFRIGSWTGGFLVGHDFSALSDVELKRKLSYYRRMMKKSSVSVFYKQNCKLLIADYEFEVSRRSGVAKGEGSCVG